uniref:Fibronectin type-II domain-containing protein n=1 Tax=Eutreptiella gymnastica TaxID=73025 RepID=A0A7S1NDL7_9EUGL|mmetsp:Transcript_19742/g.35162  ORF Transcript_19742/g.35162 Transcript_19742/m.35162 type:complete len:517 (+) Transcript_19742:55-1605(+)
MTGASDHWPLSRTKEQGEKEWTLMMKLMIIVLQVLLALALIMPAMHWPQSMAGMAGPAACQRLTEHGIQCAFPFTYKGVLHHDCVMDGKFPHGWCTTELDARWKGREKCLPCQMHHFDAVPEEILHVCILEATGLTSYFAHATRLLVQLQDGSFFEQSTTAEHSPVWWQCFRSVVPKSGDVSLNFTLKGSLLRGVLKAGEYGRGELRVAWADVEATPGSRTVLLLREGKVTGQLHVTLQMQSMPVKPAVGPVRQVFSDVDNTLVPYGSHHLFPGALQFLHEMRGNMDAPGAAAEAPLVYLLSARPDWLKPKVANHLKIGDVSIYGGIIGGNPLKTIMYDVLTHDDADIIAMFKETKRKGVQLFYSKRQLVTHKGVSEEDEPEPDEPEVGGELHTKASDGPEKTKVAMPVIPHILIGDNGEGDAEAAYALLREGYIQAAFIRKVDLSKDCKLYERKPCTLEAPHLFYFANYTEAADIALQEGYISRAAHERIVTAFANDPVPLTGCSKKIQLLDKLI